MDEDAFLDALKTAIEACELNRYFNIPAGGLALVDNHYTLIPNIEAIGEDMASPGGIKGSHAQRRMLLVLVTLWDSGQAQQLFGQDFAILPKVVMSMDARNRGILAELLYTYPGWGS